MPKTQSEISDGLKITSVQSKKTEKGITFDTLDVGNEKDLKELAILLHLGGMGRSGQTVETNEKLLKKVSEKYGGVVFFSRDNETGKINGCAMVKPGQDDSNKNFLEIAYLYVSPASRGQNLAGKFIDIVKDNAYKLNVGVKLDDQSNPAMPFLKGMNLPITPLNQEDTKKTFMSSSINSKKIWVPIKDHSHMKLKPLI